MRTSVKVLGRLASALTQDSLRRGLVKGTRPNLMLYFVLAYALCATSYQIPMRCARKAATVPNLRL